MNPIRLALFAVTVEAVAVAACVYVWMRVVG